MRHRHPRPQRRPRGRAMVKPWGAWALQPPAVGGGAQSAACLPAAARLHPTHLGARGGWGEGGLLRRTKAGIVPSSPLFYRDLIKGK